MPFDIREESLDDALSDVLTTLQATRTHAIDKSRLDWLYRENPDGPAVLWTARDSESGRIAGFTVALPRRILVDGELASCWNCADFSILPKFRSLGVALKLRRAATIEIDAGRADFLYANPNQRMAVIHQKVGHAGIGRMVRHARVLRSARYLKVRLGSSAAGTLAGSIVDPLLWANDILRRRRPAGGTSLIGPAFFDDRFDRLFQASTSAARIVGVRDARYLNWRYRSNPLYESQLIECERVGQLSGYLIFRVIDGVAHIKDLFPPNDAHTVRDLLSEMIRTGRRLGLSGLSTSLLAGNPHESFLREFGFRPRQNGSQFYVYAAGTAPCRQAVTDDNSWFMMEGDRDV
jgi:hypothetical protein